LEDIIVVPATVTDEVGLNLEAPISNGPPNIDTEPVNT